MRISVYYNSTLNVPYVLPPPSTCHKGPTVTRPPWSVIPAVTKKFFNMQGLPYSDSIEKFSYADLAELRAAVEQPRAVVEHARAAVGQ